MRTLMKIGFALLMLAVVLIALSYSMLRSKGTVGPANPAGRLVSSETRNVGKGIQSVELSGPINMTLRQGAMPSLQVRGEQRLLANVETSQDGSTLHIGTKGMLFHHREPLQVILVLPAIEHLTIHGSGESTVNGFSGDKMDVQVHGSGNVIFNGRFRDIAAAVHGSGDLELNGGNSDKVDVQLAGSGQMTVVGSCKEFKAAQNGSGDIDAQHMTAEKVSVEMRGTGTSSVSAKRSADVSLRGTGDVNVYGSPNERNVSKTGTGEVNWR
jgi:hypothetical protein